jgi:nitrate reductase gamma subunit
MGWLVGEPALVDIPEKPAHDATLNLTEDSLAEVSRYVLLYMPGTALLVALIILLKRRATEKSSRNPSEGRP